MRTRTTLLLAGLATLAAPALPAGPSPAAGQAAAVQEPPPGKTLEAFRSEAELTAFVRELLEARAERWRQVHANCGGPGMPPCAVALEAVTLADAPAGRAAGAESVTNVQHAGVDEGGIVKVHGDHLVILRRGRLFTVRIGDADLEPVSAVDAFGPDLDPRGTWYDELLVSGDVVIVIGYSYARGGTEIGLFHIDDAGGLRHGSTYHLRSNDYYSSRNYSSRLVDGELIFYAPLSLRHIRGELDDVSRILPGLRRWREGAERDGFEPIASYTRVYRPARELDPASNVALHTVTACDVSGAELDCHATVVFGPWGHTFYVSPGSVYVWLAGWRGRRDAERAPSLLYRMPLDGSAPTALGVAGSPVDQFSFLESDDGRLNVLVRAGARGQWMWGAERSGGGTALLRVPLSAFGDGRDDAPEHAYRPLPSPRGRALRNRFVGDHLLYGTGAGWGFPGARDRSVLYAVRWRDGRLTRVRLDHGVDRIEAMGGGAVIVGADERDLHFTSVRLGSRPESVDQYTLPDASQGELRSHGFFYRADGRGAGVLGLPVRAAGRPGWAHLRHGSASILFLEDRSLRLTELGRLESRPGPDDDACRASCVDWYGNARPLFLRGRIFALLGYELVEGELRRGRIHEVRRASFAPERPLAGEP